MIVNDIMTRRVDAVYMDDSVEKVRMLFDCHNYHHLIVQGDNSKCVGIISDRDLLRNISPYIGKICESNSDRALLQRRAHQIMTRELVAVRTNTSLPAAARVMLDHRISCLPVVEQNGRCIGIVTLRDFVKWSLQSMTQSTTQSTLKVA